MNRFKTVLLLSAAALLCSLPLASTAADNTLAAPDKPSLSSRLFPAGVTFSTFATMRFDNEETRTVDAPQKSGTTDSIKKAFGGQRHLGGGLGADAFFNRYLGIGAEVLSETPDRGLLVDQANAKLILRLPIGILAPYAFGGGGYQFEARDAVVFGGGGLSCAVSKNGSIFADARWQKTFAERSDGVPFLRGGITFRF